MRVLYVIGQNAGGLPHYTAELANAVAEHAEVTVMKPVETTADGLFADEIDVVEPFESISVSMPNIYKLNVDPIELVRGVLSYDNLKRIADLDADVTHVTTGLFPQVKFFSWFHNVAEVAPLVVTHHEVPNSPFSSGRPPVFVEELINVAIPDLDEAGIVVHTEQQKQALMRRGKDPDVIEVIPHGAYSLFGDDGDVDASPERNSILFFGNLVPPKGVDTAVEAIPVVKREIPDVKLIIAGDGRIPSRSKSVIEAHPENFEVHNYFVPNERVKEFFARAEVVALPYRDQDGTKGHSGALATAFSFGKPVVASTAGDFRKLVAESGAGTVVPPDDPGRLADAVARTLNDAEARGRMSSNSRRMAEELSWDNVARQYLELYRSVCPTAESYTSVVQ